MSGALYNEIEPYAVQWLRNLEHAGHIAPGRVEHRSITELVPADVAGVTQAHFFAGIGIWSHALRLAGWPDSLPVWTGSCPCQPFSTAGRIHAMTDDWKSRAVPAVSRFGASLHQPSTRRMELAELDADDYARPAKAQPSSPLHGIPASIYSDMRALQCLIERAPLAAWRIDGLKLPSVANLREHHHAKAARMKRQRATARASVKYPLTGCMDSTLLPAQHTSVVVLLVRVSPRTLDRHDNLPSCMKACVDGIADALGTDDRSPGLHFHYAQEKGPHALRVLVVEGPTR